MNNYVGGETIEVISGKYIGKKGYISRVDNIDGSLLIVNGIPETEKFRVEPCNVKRLNDNFAIYGYVDVIGMSSRGREWKFKLYLDKNTSN